MVGVRRRVNHRINIGSRQVKLSFLLFHPTEYSPGEVEVLPQLGLGFHQFELTVIGVERGKVIAVRLGLL